MNPMQDRPSIGQELLDVPMGDMIREMALAIAEAQITLDANSIEVAKLMGGLQTITNSRGEVTFRDSRVFFGREKLTLTEAVGMFNTTSDSELKAALVHEIGDDTNVDDNNRRTVKTSADPGRTVIIPTRLSMMELGFSPTFYQFVDTIIEVKISITYTASGSQYDSSYDRDVSSSSKSGSSGKGLLSYIFGTKRSSSSSSRVTTSQVNASYSQKYSYTAEGASLLRTKLVPIPPPAILEERIRANMEVARSEDDKPEDGE